MSLGRLAQSPLLLLLSSTVLGQAILSAANLGVGLLLIRHASDIDYGHYVLVQTTLMLLTGLQGGWITGPLTVLASKQPEAERKQMIGAAYRGQQRLARLTALLALPLLLLLWTTGVLDQEKAALCAATVLAGWAVLEREYLRAILLIYTRAGAIVGADGVYVAVLLASVAAAVFWLPAPMAVWAVLGLAAAALAANLLARRSLARDPGWSQQGGEGIWREMRPLGLWAITGILVYWSFSQGYNYLLAARLDVQAVAAVAATRLLLMPVNLLTAGVKGVLVPLASRWLPQLGIPGLIRRLALLGLGILVPAALYCLLLWIFRDWVYQHLLQKQIAQRDLMLALWTGIFLLCMLRDTVQTVLFVRERFKLLTYLATINAVFSFAAMLLLMEHFGAPGAVMGILLGELLYTAGVMALLRRETKMATASPTMAG